MTFQHLLLRLFGILSLAILATGAYFVWSWWDWRTTYEAIQARGGLEADRENWRLVLGGALLLWSAFGRLPVLWLAARHGDDADRLRRQDGLMLEAPHGARVHVERYGSNTAPALIFVHGWGLDAGIWWEARRKLSDRFQVLAFDLPGLGRSKGFSDGRYSLERFAETLNAVAGLAGRRQVVLIGHSIGGMTLQTFARQYSEQLGGRVAGMALENTTHTDPTRTTFLGGLLSAMRPLLIVAMKLDIWLSPLVWALNWQSYLSGSTHLAMRISGFGTQPTRAQLEQVARAATQNSPAVQAKGNLAMMHWSATADLPRLRVPTLVFIGGRDLVTRPDAGETIARNLPQARLTPMPKAGHMGPVELAKDYNDVLEAFAVSVIDAGQGDLRTAGSVLPGDETLTPEPRTLPPSQPRL